MSRGSNVNNSNILASYIVEKEGVSDNNYELTIVNFSNGTLIEKGDVLLEYETSKTAIEVISEFDGYFYSPFIEGDEVKVGDVVAYVTKNISEVEFYAAEAESDLTDAIVTEDLVIDEPQKLTKSAKQLIEDIKELSNGMNGKGYITRKNLVDKILSELFLMKAFDYSNDNRIILVGAGGMVETAIQAAKLQGKYQIVGILDSSYKKVNNIMGIPIIGTQEHASRILHQGVKKAIVTFASANNRIKRQVEYDRLESIGFEMINIIHPEAYIDPSAQVGHGNLILEGAKIGTQCEIGNNNYINVNSVLCHHSKLEGNIHLAPASVVAGFVEIGRHSLIGMSSTIVSGAKIGENVVVNNGANVVSDIANNSVIKVKS